MTKACMQYKNCSSERFLLTKNVGEVGITDIHNLHSHKVIRTYFHNKKNADLHQITCDMILFHNKMRMSERYKKE
jgi:hypothetical protein